ncbi:DUF4410 domain-containing protein [Methylomicrobium lacus]|uniref:DUF4410 domain-containing protein n=1 Tax=Methylomicrobium lacus TaxID=136992 RepID=UPI0035A872D9
MAYRNFTAHLVCLIICIAWITGCQTKRDSVLGAVEVIDEEIKGPWPAGVPKTLYVSDFALEAEKVEVDQGVRGILPKRRQSPIGQRLPHPMAHADPEEQAKKIIDTMSRSLIKHLINKGLAAQRLSPRQSLPREGWLIQGVFTEVGQGNRIKRATIGFGRGATSMEAQVAVSNLARANPKSPFLVFGTMKSAKKMPGAVVTMNPYVAAAKFVLEKNASEKDIDKTAEQIVAEILKHTQKFKEQAESGK